VERKHVDLRDNWPFRVQKAFSYCARNLKTEAEFKAKMESYYEHWQGKHDTCSHNMPMNPPPQYRCLHSKTISILKEIFDPIIQDSSKYLHGRTTNHCESFNSLIAHFAPKHIRHPSYTHLVNLAVLRKTIGVRAPLFVLRSLKISVPNEIQLYFSRKERKANKDAARRQSPKYKQQRAQKKIQRQKKKDAKPYPEFFYGKQDLKEKVKCGHKVCNNLRCRCMKDGVGCSEKCGCGGTCSNYYNVDSVAATQRKEEEKQKKREVKSGSGLVELAENSGTKG